MVIVEGTIKGKARPRVFGKHAVTPEDTVNYENWVKICYQQQDGRHFFNEPIRADIRVYHKVPKSYSKKRIEGIKQGLERPQKKPDADNIAKIILDSLNGIAYKDDSQVIELQVSKFFTFDNERVEFDLRAI
ncbi:RusA family crossover junction endodeoxyribonuclease [Clostridium sp. YIM B02500]|uniref:RusA family crossover junction endodeoxyribonuclease n=1 Tax=Clostridium sp. YIM B02500 TaxID=2910681 RepID=UPI001EEEF4D8|nr:RusA family crossover junction endodeoxyribonuclease [Clostridium sp. YIM B02500]